MISDPPNKSIFERSAPLAGRARLTCGGRFGVTMVAPVHHLNKAFGEQDLTAIRDGHRNVAARADYRANGFYCFHLNLRQRGPRRKLTQVSGTVCSYKIPVIGRLFPTRGSARMETVLQAVGRPRLSVT